MAFFPRRKNLKSTLTKAPGPPVPIQGEQPEPVDQQTPQGAPPKVRKPNIGNVMRRKNMRQRRPLV